MKLTISQFWAHIFTIMELSVLMFTEKYIIYEYCHGRSRSRISTCVNILPLHILSLYSNKNFCEIVCDQVLPINLENFNVQHRMKPQLKRLLCIGIITLLHII